MISHQDEWLIIAIFLALPFVLSIFEGVWLAKTGYGSMAKSMVFAFVTNIIGLGIGYFILFAMLGVLMASAWDGSLTKFSETQLWIYLAVAGVLIPVLLALIKRGMFHLLRMGGSKRIWINSLVSGILIFIASLGVPILTGYLLFK